MTAPSELTSGPAPSPPVPARALFAWPQVSVHRATWAVAFGAALIVAGLVLHATAYDRLIFLSLNAGSGLPEAIPSMLSVAGLGVSVFVGVCAWTRRPSGLLSSLLLAFVLGTLLVHGLKYGLRWPRPGAVLLPEQVHRIGLQVSGRAMPSGHAATAFTVWALLMGSLPRSWRALVGGGLLAVGVAWSRLAVGAHWPGDVLVGAGLGLWVGTAALGLSRRWDLATRWDRAGLRTLLRCVLLACAVYLIVVPTGDPAAEPMPWVLAAVAGWTAWRARGLHP